MPAEADDTPVAFPEGAASPAGEVRPVHPLGQPTGGDLQDRGLPQSGQTVGKEKKPARHEL